MRNLADDAGDLLATYTYDGFGNVLSDSNPGLGERYQFTSRERDEETGLQYSRARYYDAATGRWTSQDPLGFDAGDSNLYRYVGNAPTNATDPSGYWSFARHVGLQQRATATLTKEGNRIDPERYGGGKVQVKDGPHGAIVVHTGAEFTSRKEVYKNAISIKYTDERPNVSDVQFYQFFWYEMLIKYTDKNKKVVEAAMGITAPTTIGIVKSSKDKNSPIYYVDSISKKSPEYLAEGAGIRTKDSMTLLDRVGKQGLEELSMDKKFGENPNVISIKQIHHFDTFLMYKNKSIYSVSWTSTYTWERKNNTIEGPFYEFMKEKSGPNIQPVTAQTEALLWKYFKFPMIAIFP